MTWTLIAKICPSKKRITFCSISDTTKSSRRPCFQRLGQQRRTRRIHGSPGLAVSGRSGLNQSNKFMRIHNLQYPGKYLSKSSNYSLTNLRIIPPRVYSINTTKVQQASSRIPTWQPFLSRSDSTNEPEAIEEPRRIHLCSCIAKKRRKKIKQRTGLISYQIFYDFHLLSNILQ